MNEKTIGLLSNLLELYRLYFVTNKMHYTCQRFYADCRA